MLAEMSDEFQEYQTDDQQDVFHSVLQLLEWHHIIGKSILSKAITSDHRFFHPPYPTSEELILLASMLTTQPLGERSFTYLCAKQVPSLVNSALTSVTYLSSQHYQLHSITTSKRIELESPGWSGLVRF